MQTQLPLSFTTSTITKLIIFFILSYPFSNATASSKDKKEIHESIIFSALSIKQVLNKREKDLLSLIDDITDDLNNVKSIIAYNGSLRKANFLKLTKKFKNMKVILAFHQTDKYTPSLNYLVMHSCLTYITMWDDYCNVLQYSKKEIIHLNDTVNKIKSLNILLKSKPLKVALIEMAN
jgi:hypothetical protein